MTAVLATSCTGPLAPSWRIRILRYADPLRARGIELNSRPLLGEVEARRLATAHPLSKAWSVGRAECRRRRRGATDGASVVWLQRHASFLPSPRSEARVIADRRLVLDVDDAIWITGATAGGHPLARLKRTDDKLEWLARRADAVMVGNDYLAEHLRAAGARDVRIVPSVVDIDAVPTRDHVDDDELVLGWIGSPSTARYLDAIRPALAAAATQLAPRRLVVLVVGGTMEPVDGVDVVMRRWSETEEVDALRRIDIGLMPLPDDPWTRGKCAYKALQYMASGIPVVCPDVGVSADVVGHGRGGLVVASDDDWVDAIVALADDVRLRAELGQGGRETVSSDFSVSGWADRVAATLTGD